MPPASAHAEFLDRADDSRLCLFGKIVVERKAKQSICYPPGLRAVEQAILPSHGRAVQGDIVKHAKDASSLQMFDQLMAFFERRHEQIEHVKRLFAVWRYIRQTDVIAL